MDYQLFLLAAIRERYEATGDTRCAIADGIAQRVLVPATMALLGDTTGTSPAGRNRALPHVHFSHQRGRDLATRHPATPVTHRAAPPALSRGQLSGDW